MNETTDATAIFAPIWRRKWLILIVAILVAAGSYLYYKRQPTKFQNSTEVYLAAGAEEQFTEKGVGKSTAASTSNQTALINSIVVELAKRTLRKEHTKFARAAAKGKVRAKSPEKSQFITITTEAHTAKGSALLANTVAALYIKRQHAQYVRGIKSAIAISHRQLRKLEAPRVSAGSKGKPTTSTTNVIQAATLSSKINQLESQLSVIGVEQVKPATNHSALLLGPQPKKNAIFGFVLGLVLATIAAFALSRFNRRLRSLADIETVLQAQVLTALPKVGRPIVHRDGRPAPSKPLIEPLRRLHTTLRLGNVLEQEQQSPPRSILFLSADAGDGKSTLIANLALVSRDAGERAAILEADFRRPVQSKLLGLSATRGLADVLTGSAPATQAMQAVASADAPAADPAAAPDAGVATALASRGEGGVSVLVGAAGVANPPVLLASSAMTELLRSAAEEYDQVLLDVPSPLEVSDAMPLLSAVDAIVLVARVAHTREASAQRLMQLLMRTPSAPVIGVVANGVARKDMEKYGISSGSSGSRWPAKLFGR